MERYRALREHETAWLAVKRHLDTPYPDDPRWTPWTRFAEPAIKRARALAEAEQGAVSVLETIRERAGAVCPEYETCEHPACQASYAAWALADRYLSGGGRG